MFRAWREFRRGKSSKRDVQEFEFNLEDNLFQLHADLVSRAYQHSPYSAFYITDPKLRHIHKACVRDRVLHHAVFRVLYPLWDRTFIHDSYSCRLGKGTHRAVRRLEVFARKLSRNLSRPIYALKCDVKKFFDSVDHELLLGLIKHKVSDAETIWLIGAIIDSFGQERGRGLPIGNVTSQLFANIYINELDKFIKQELQIQYYIRYCDDFVILGLGVDELGGFRVAVEDFLTEHLKLSLHPDKIIIKKFAQGIDFLGYVVLPYHRVLRTKTKKRMLQKLHALAKIKDVGLTSDTSCSQSAQSYLGLLSHCDGYNVQRQIEEILL